MDRRLTMLVARFKFHSLKKKFYTYSTFLSKSCFIDVEICFSEGPYDSIAYSLEDATSLISLTFCIRAGVIN